jgi:outer membrane protein assembly factor BamB
VNDCATLRFSGSESDFCDDGFYDYIPSDPCEGIYAPQGEDSGETSGTETSTRSSLSGLMSPLGETAGALPDVASCVRILRFVGGLAPLSTQHWDRGIANPEQNDPLWNTPTFSSQFIINTANSSIDQHTANDVNNYAPSLVLCPPLSMQDQATLELTDPNYDLTPYYSYNRSVSPPTRTLLAPGRNLSIQDAILALRLPLTGPSTAAWTMGFIGNNLSGGNAANATAMPAIAKLDPSGPWNAVFLMGANDGTNYPNPQATTGLRGNSNPNMVYVLADTTGGGGYGLTVDPTTLKMRDGPMGVTLADTQGSGKRDILVCNQQDDYADGTHSHLFAWSATGSPISPFAPANLDSLYGNGIGHTTASAPVYDLNNDGVPEIFFTSNGQQNLIDGKFYNGGMQIIEPRAVTVNGRQIAKGDNLFQTSITTNTSTPWRLGVLGFQADLQVPPVLAPVSLTDAQHPAQQRNVFAGSYLGDVYGWDQNGATLPGFPLQTDVPPNDYFQNPAPVYMPMVAADVDGVTGTGGSLHSELLLATGSILNATDWDRVPGLKHNDGAIYCWSQTGQRLWRYPAASAADMNPAYASGLAVGRLHGTDTNPNTGRTYAPCVVAVDAGGTVVALNGETGTPFWTYDIKPVPSGTTFVKTKHLYSRGSVTEPLILDVNADGHQDVIIGTTHGEIYILNGLNGSVMWKEHTFRAPDSVTYDGEQDGTFIHYVEPQYEEVRGLAVGPLNTGKPNHAVLLVTSGRAALTVPNPIGGHAMLFDLSDVLYPTTPEAQRPATWNASAADWPQYQGNAQCTGSYPGP